MTTVRRFWRGRLSEWLGAINVLLVLGVLGAPLAATRTLAAPLAVSPDLGDAPNSNNGLALPMPLYAAGPSAQFPTVYSSASVTGYGPLHRNSNWAPLILGTAISAEAQADSGPDADGVNNINPTANLANQDRADDGLAPTTATRCTATTWTYQVTVQPGAPTKGYVNIWIDWNSSGRWGDRLDCGGALADEWAVQNQPLALTAPGTFTFTTPSFVFADVTQRPQWVRITLSETPDTDALARQGGGLASGWEYGETEDQLLSGAADATPTPTKQPTPTCVIDPTGGCEPTITPTRELPPTSTATREPTITPTRELPPTSTATREPTITPTRELPPTSTATREPTITPTRELPPTSTATRETTITPNSPAAPDQHCDALPWHHGAMCDGDPDPRYRLHCHTDEVRRNPHCDANEVRRELAPPHPARPASAISRPARPA